MPILYKGMLKYEAVVAARVRVVIVLPLLTSRTGPPRFVSGLARALRARGHEVYVYSLLYQPESTFEELREERVEELSKTGFHFLRGVVTRTLRAFQRKYGKIGVYINGVPLSVFISPILVFISVLKVKPDVVIVNSGNTLMFLLKSLCRILVRKDVKFVLYYHGFLETQANTLLAKLLRPFEKLSMLKCVFIANSRTMADEFEKTIGIRPLVLNIGIDIEKFSRITRQDNGHTLLYVGRFSPYRRHDFLLGVIKLLRENGFKVRLILAGALSSADIQYLRYLLRKIDELNLKDQVVILPNVSDDELLRLYSKVTIYVNPIEETYGINILEALAAGLPVVTLKGGQSDIVRHGIEGFLVKEDPQEWCKALIKLLTDKDLWCRMSEAARRRAMELSWGRVVTKLELILNKL